MSLGIPGVVSDCSEGIRDLWQLPADVGDCHADQPALKTPFGVLIPLGIDDLKPALCWVEEIEKLLCDPTQRNQYAKACRRRASDYDIDHVTQLWSQHLLNPSNIND
jgi:hypothetical protein